MAKGHYIPQTYLRNFKDKSMELEKELTWRILKRPNNEILRVPILEICQKKNLYLLKSFDNQIDKEFVEKKIYSENIEREYRDAYNILINPEKTDISKDEKELILISILSLYYRHLDGLEDKNTIDENEIKYISKYLTDKGKETKFTRDDLTIDFSDPEMLISKIKSFNKEEFAIYHLSKSFDLIKKRFNDSICVLKLQDNFAFVSSDRPFYFNNYFGFLSFCIPLDKSHLVLISPIEFGNDKINRITYDNEDLCTTIELINNEIQYRLSKNIIFAENKNILERLLMRRKEYGLDLIPDDSVDFSSMFKEKHQYGY